MGSRTDSTILMDLVILQTSLTMSTNDIMKNCIKRVLPDPVLFWISPKITWMYAKIFTWYTCGRYHSAPIDPFEIYHINVEDIDRCLLTEGKSKFRYHDGVSEVVGGNWQAHTEDIEKRTIFKAFIRRFEDNKKWKDTMYYEKVVSEISQGETRWGCTSVSEFEQRLQSLDRLHKSLQNNGYRSQRYLRNMKNNDVAVRRIHEYWPPEFHEITINISQNGEPILHEGRHRMYMAKVLGIKKIPVRIKTRHESWQEKRNDVFNSNIYKNHFDLRF